MKKWLALFLILISFSFPLMANENCGIDDNGEVKPADTEICREDIAFSVLYDSFREFYDNYILKVFPLENFGDSEEENLGSKLRTSDLMGSMFKNILDVTFIFIFLVVIYNIIFGIFKSLEDGTFMGKDFSFKTQGIYYLIGIFLLIPLGDILVVHIIIITLALIAIVPANFIFSFFVYFVSAGANAPSLSINEERYEYDHNYYFASRMIDYYKTSDFCRRSTFNYIYTDSADHWFNREDNYKNCFQYENNKDFEGLERNFDNRNPFFNYYYESPREGYGFYNELISGKIVENQECEPIGDGDHITDFTCGSVRLKAPTVENFPVLEIDYEYFLNSVEETIPLLSLSGFNGEQLNDRFKLFYEGYKAIAEEKEVDNFVSSSERKNLHMQLLTAWYTAIFNHVNYGTKIVNKNNNILSVRYENFNYIDSLINEAEKLAEMEYKIHCLQNPDLLLGSYNFIEDNNDNNKNAFCLQLSEEYYGFEELSGISMPLESESDFNTLFEIRERETEIYNEAKANLINLIAEDFHQIERGLYLSYGLVDRVNYEETSVFVEARKKGFLAFPQVLLFIEEAPNGWVDVRNVVFNSIDFSLNVKDIMNVSSNVYQEDEEKNNNAFKINDYLGLRYQERIYPDNTIFVGKIRNPSNYITDQQGEGFFDAVFSNTLSYLISPNIGALFETMGIQDFKFSEDEQKDFVAMCSNVYGLENCPLPTSNPLVAFNRLGVEYIKDGAVILATTTGFSQLTSIFEKRMSLRGSNSFFTTSPRLLQILSFASSLLSMYAFILIMAGVILAISIPLIPFIYMVINFIQWVIHIFNLMFVSNIFVGYLFNISEARDKVVSFFRENILYVILTPTLVIVSMIFLWSFYLIAIFFVNLTLFSFLSSANNVENISGVAEFILGAINPIMTMVVLLFVIFAITKFVFSEVSSLHQKIFNRIDVEMEDGTQGFMGSVFGAFALSSIFNKGISKSKSLSDNPSRLAEKMKKKKDKNKLIENIMQKNKKELPEYIEKDGQPVKVDYDNLKIGDKKYKNEEDLALAIMGEDVYGEDTIDTLDNENKLIDSIFTGKKNEISDKIKGLDIENSTYLGKKYEDKVNMISAIKANHPELFRIKDKEDLELIKKSEQDFKDSYYFGFRKRDYFVGEKIHSDLSKYGVTLGERGKLLEEMRSINNWFNNKVESFQSNKLIKKMESVNFESTAEGSALKDLEAVKEGVVKKLNDPNLSEAARNKILELGEYIEFLKTTRSFNESDGQYIYKVLEIEEIIKNNYNTKTYMEKRYRQITDRILKDKENKFLKTRHKISKDAGLDNSKLKGIIKDNNE